MSFTDKQQQAIDVRKNCAVTAGAGSGKTAVLSARFADLVIKDKCDCDRILTITFTKKATSEMKQRIHSLLVEKNLKNQLELFSSAYISTFDSFLSEIARTDCRSYGLSGDFSVADSFEFKKDILKLAHDFLLSKKNTDITNELLDYASIEQLSEFLRTLEEHFFDFSNPVNWKTECKKALGIAEKLRKRKVSDITEYCKEYIDEFSSDSKLLPNCKMLEDVLQSQDFSKISFVPRIQGCKENAPSAKLLKEKILKEQSDIVVFDSLDEELAEKLYDLVGRFEQEVMLFKRKNAVLTFNNIMQLAIDILQKNTQVRTFYKNRFDYVMVDEFQDNNDSYRKLLYLLCEKKDILKPSIPDVEDLEPNKLFLVGDEKQSIYKFRGADVSVFKKISENLGEKISLDTNFRSTAKLVSHFNYLFRYVFEDSVSDYDASFEEVKARDDGRTDLPSKIVFNSFYSEGKGNEDDASLALSEAFSIANLIEKMLNTDEFLIKDKDGRPVRPKESDIAVLMRTSTWQINLERALRLKKIKYSLTETRAMTTEALVNDFYNVLQLCVYPYDSISAAAYLHSPFCNKKTSDLDTENIKELIEKDNNLEMVSNLLQEGELSKAVLYIWNDMGYRVFIVSNPANQVYEEHFETLFSLALEFEKKSKTVFDFLDYLRPLLGTSEKMIDLSVLSANSDGVQLMTIHKSKGLQFPIVIVASMGSRPRPDTASLKAYKMDETVILPVCKLTNFAYILNQDVEKDKENAELKRLLYVASTRASQHLVYSSIVKPSDLDEKEKKSQTLLSLFLKAYDYENIDQYLEKTSFERIKVEDTFSYGRLTRSDLEKALSLYSNFKEQKYDYSKHIKAVTDNDGQNTESGFTKDRLPSLTIDSYIVQNNLSTEFGTLCHSLIENRINNVKDSPYKDTTLLEAAKSLADGFINSKSYKIIEKMSKKAEQEFYFELDGEMMHGVIDLLCEDSNQIIIYDYKTDIFKNPEMHRFQLETYASAMNTISNGRQVMAYVVYLRDPDNPVRIV